jgi:tubulin-specific chaperone A
MSAAETPAQKALRIKTQVVHRTHKELQHYHLELQQQKEKVAKMREEGRDVFDVKKQVEVLAESEVMIPDTMRRLDKAVEDLRGAVAMAAADAELAGSEQLAAAKAMLAELDPAAAAAGGGGGGGGGAGGAAAAPPEDDGPI